ncbi:hypothetical protein MKX01_040045 [Papaver californicum]|nr:hypothetical protein MKX01_040045 [Papaver californicum]
MGKAKKSPKFVMKRLISSRMIKKKNYPETCKLDLEKAMMDCLYAKCTPCITDCVMAELEKLGQKYSFEHKCYIVATCDRDLKRRIRKIPGVPIMYITNHKYSIERLPEATLGGAPRY